MKEYIEREAAINTINKLRICLRERGAYDYDLGAAEAKLRVEEIPAADVRPVVRGKWERKRYGPWASGLKCSKCELLFDIATDQPSWNFCPACGAKMDGGVNKEEEE